MIPVSDNPERDAYGRLLQLPRRGTVKAADLAPELIGQIFAHSNVLFDKLPPKVRRVIQDSLFGVPDGILDNVFDIAEQDGEEAAVAYFLKAQEQTRRQLVTQGKLIPRPAEEIVMRRNGIEWRSR